MRTQAEKVLKKVRAAGKLTASDATKLGISPVVLTRLVRRGELIRLGRALYGPPDEQEPTEFRSLVQAARQVPTGVVCLLSALRFHGLTTQNPFEVWLAIPHKARARRLEELSIHYVRFSGQALSFGVEERQLEGTPVRVYSAAKTVADCFKHRNKLGLDVALEALRDYRRGKRWSADELWRAAKVCRVERVMRPYLEALT